MLVCFEKVICIYDRVLIVHRETMLELVGTVYVLVVVIDIWPKELANGRPRGTCTKNKRWKGIKACG